MRKEENEMNEYNELLNKAKSKGVSYVLRMRQFATKYEPSKCKYYFFDKHLHIIDSSSLPFKFVAHIEFGICDGNLPNRKLVNIEDLED